MKNSLLQALRAIGITRWARCPLGLILAAFCLGFPFGALPSLGCDIPVFRYALERWKPDSYRVTVIHHGPLSQEQQGLVQELEKPSTSGNPQGNLKLEILDSAKEGEETRIKELLGTVIPLETPLLVVRYPESTKIQQTFWKEPLRSEDFQALLDSPARRELARRILGGHSVVWVLLECGDEERDKAVENLLASTLAKLEDALGNAWPQLAVPESPAEGDAAVSQICFSFLRVSRTAPEERMLARMLLQSEPGIAGRLEPMVFPVYGRGRLLYALVGAGINEQNLREAAGFLVGECSCDIKEQNPGVDLLMAADWGSVAGGAEFSLESLPSTVKAGELVPIPVAPKASVPVSERKTLSAPQQAEAPPESQNRRMLLVGVVLAGLAVVLTGVWALRSGRGSQSPK